MHLDWRAVELERDLKGNTGPAILTSVTMAETAELQRLAKGKRVLEVGSANGYSSVVMALAGAEYVIAVDDHNGTTWLGDTRANMEANLAAYKIDGSKVCIFAANSQVALPKLAEDGNAYDLIFIDGDHTLDGASADIANALKLIAPGGTIAVHDFLEHCCCPDVMYAVNRAFPEGPSYTVDTMAVISR